MLIEVTQSSFGEFASKPQQIPVDLQHPASATRPSAAGDEQLELTSTNLSFQFSITSVLSALSFTFFGEPRNREFG
jgi:hypothetical protein